MRITKRPDERRAELLGAARALFDERGVEKTRVSDIVGRVGVAQGVFYYYFRSKDEIVRAVTEQVEDEIRVQAAAILGMQAGFSKKLSAFIDLYIGVIDQFLGDDETSLTALEAGMGRARFPAHRAQALLAECLVQLAERAAADGELAVEYPGQTALVLLYGLHRLAADRLPKRNMIHAIAEQCLGLAKGSLASP